MNVSYCTFTFKFLDRSKKHVFLDNTKIPICSYYNQIFNHKILWTIIFYTLWSACISKYVLTICHLKTISSIPPILQCLWFWPTTRSLWRNQWILYPCKHVIQHVRPYNGHITTPPPWLPLDGLSWMWPLCVILVQQGLALLWMYHHPRCQLLC